MASVEFDRVPPQNIEAEQAVLGSMMLDKDAITDVAEILVPEDYYRPAHETVHLAIIELYSRGEPVDALTLSAELKRNGDLERIGGGEYLHTLMASVITPANADYYARIVRERSQLRSLVEAGTRIVQLGYAEAGGDVDDIVDAAQSEIFAVSERRHSTDYVALSELSDPLLAELEKIEKNKDVSLGVPTGIHDLDSLTTGLQPGQMVIVAARPAMGKSTLALNFLRSAAIHNDMASVVFSLEMSRAEIGMRLVAAESQVRFGKMRRGDMNADEWRKITQTIAEISEKPLFIDDSPNMAMNEIRSKCRRLKQQNNLKLVVIDYLQLMTSGRLVESRQQEVSEFSRSLKLLAKELEVPVVAVAQLNRGPEQRTDKKPMLADLRESGSLEQDADVVMLLHRPDYYSEDERPGEADIIVAKHRNGETRTIPVAFQGHYARFTDLARDMG
ncbi:replicative DNA helicase [Gleimia hominis]|uniref:replicative DNA helicase n=1 Tax=Gleimia hominis TaxID=595468 RepID=UPI000C80DA52|nr:replicative DNA helicase [Gleimia hominis]WIK64156.1 replicative DNA helicase [Gleimia hominis]